MKANSDPSVIRLSSPRAPGATWCPRANSAGRWLRDARPNGSSSPAWAKPSREIAFPVDTGIYCFNAGIENRDPEHLGDRRGEGADGQGRHPGRSGRRRQDPPQDHHGQGRGLRSASPGFAPARSMPMWRNCRASASPASTCISASITDLAPFDQAYGLLADLVRDLLADGHVIDHVDAGGGLGIPTGSTSRRRPHLPPMARSCAGGSATSAAASCSSRAGCSSAMPECWSPKWST